MTSLYGTIRRIAARRLHEVLVKAGQIRLNTESMGMGGLRYWTAAVTDFGEEQRAAHHIEKSGFRYYLPEILVENPRGELTRRRPLFPGYILVKLRMGWETISQLRGVRRMLLTDYQPLRVPQREIDYLRSLEDEHGFVTLGPRLRPGDKVRVGEGGGAFSRSVGRVLRASAGKCEVLLTLMGCETSKVFDSKILETA